MSDINPNGNISSVEEIGALVRKYRKQNSWRIEDVSGIANIGARFVSEFERGKETVELGKVLKVLNVLGLEVVIRPRGQRDFENQDSQA